MGHLPGARVCPGRTAGSFGGLSWRDLCALLEVFTTAKVTTVRDLLVQSIILSVWTALEIIDLSLCENLVSNVKLSGHH